MMKPIYNELKYAEKLIERTEKIQLSNSEVGILVKYYRYIGQTDSQIFKTLRKYCNDHYDEYNEDTHEKYLRNIINSTKKKSLKIPGESFVTKSEIEKIREVGNYKYEKILFAMLIDARCEKENKGSSEYYANKKLSQYCTFVKVHLEKNEKNEFENKMVRLGYFVATQPHGQKSYRGRRTVTNYQLLFANEDSEKEIVFDDYELAFSLYPIYCESCNNKIENPTMKRKICDDCYREERKEKINNNAKKYYKDKFYTDS